MIEAARPRGAGRAELAGISAVVLEADGSMSIIHGDVETLGAG